MHERLLQSMYKKHKHLNDERLVTVWQTANVPVRTLQWRSLNYSTEFF